MSKQRLKYLHFLKDYMDFRNRSSYSTNDAVNKIEEELGIKFPLAYRELYLITGAPFAFAFHPHTDFIFDQYKAMLDCAKAITAEDGSVLMDDPQVFVFALFKPYSFFWYFRLDEGDDPPVYQYGDDTEEQAKIAGSFSSYIKTMPWYQRYLNEREDKTGQS